MFATNKSRAANKSKCHNKDYFEIKGKQAITLLNKGEHVKFENFGRKVEPPFMIYADFESILVPHNSRYLRVYPR